MATAVSDITSKVIAAASRALSVDRQAVTECAPIKHGLTNENWLVRTAQDAVVVRISNAAEDELQIDRVSEAAILKMMDAAGIGAPVLLFDPEARTLVTRYLGEHLPQAAMQAPQSIARVAHLLKRLHGLPPPPQAKVIDLQQSLTRYFQTLDAWGKAPELSDPALRTRALQAAVALHSQAPAVLCHTDVHHRNLIDHDGTLRLIDWEYAGISAPAFDLASLCIFEHFDAAQRRMLLEHYAGPAAQAWIDSLELACWLFDYVRELWFAVLEGDGKALR